MDADPDAPCYRIVPQPGLAMQLPHFTNGLSLLKDSTINIGRSCRGKSDLEIPTSWVQFSSRHAVVTRDHNEQDVCIMLTDTSTNGSYVNGTRVAKGVPVRLRVGDVIRLSVPDPKTHEEFSYVLTRPACTLAHQLLQQI